MVTQQISLKVWEANQVTLQTNEGEVDSRYIEVCFKNPDQSNLSLVDRSVTFYALKPDGTQIFNTCTVNTITNTATIGVTSQMLSAPGVLECEFQIFSGENLLLKVNGLKIIVSTEIGFSEAIESTSEFNTLVEALNEARGFSEDTGDVSDLTTTEKNTIVAAINELNAKVIPVSQGGTGGNTATSARASLDIMKETELYYNASGTSGTVTLSSSIDNYRQIGIYIYGSNSYNYRGYQRINGAAGYVSLTMTCPEHGRNGSHLYTAMAYIEGTTIIYNRNPIYLLLNNPVTIDSSATNCIKIYRVVGYNY